MPVHLSQSCEDSCKTNSAESRQNATASICQITGHIIEPSPHQMLFDQLLLPHPTSLANHKLTQNPVESLSNSEVFWSRPKVLVACSIWFASVPPVASSITRQRSPWKVKCVWYLILGSRGSLQSALLTSRGGMIGEMSKHQRKTLLRNNGQKQQHEKHNRQQNKKNKKVH